MVRSVLFHGPGRPLELVRLPTPEPRGAELLVRVTTCTLCRSDLHTHAGRRAEPTPTVLGHEVVGRVEAFGPAAPRVDAAGVPVRVGDRVSWAIVASCGACFYCAEGLPQKCERPYKYGHERATPERPFGGGLADVIVLVPGTAWFRVPDDLPDSVAAPANCATATAAALLRQAGPVAGRCVLVLGAGVLGLTVCAMARAAGARAVLAADPAPEARQRAAAFGATAVIPAELAAQVAEVTGGRGVDVAFELAGAAATVEAALALVRTGGTVLLAGTVAPVGNVGLDPEKVVRRMLTVRGSHNYHPRDLGAALGFLAGPGRKFPLESLVAATYPLEQAEQAFAQAHALPGARVVVVPDYQEGR
jgi:alcohol dehydrogenase